MAKWQSLPFAEAIEFLLAKTGITKTHWLDLDRKSKLRAFTVAHVSNVEVIGQVLQGLIKAQQEGTPLKEFQSQWTSKLQKEWHGTVANPSARVENIYRTNMQSVYSLGRVSQQLSPAALERRPYGRISAILDKRTSAICRSLTGTIARLDSPWFRTHYPPFHFQCRTTVIAITAEQAVGAKDPPDTKPQDGFGDVMADWQAPSDEELLYGKKS